MESYLWVLVVLLVLVIVALTLKIYSLQKSAREIQDAFKDKLKTETNTLICISSKDRYMKNLANEINNQLRKLRKDRHRFQSGDLEVKEAMTNIAHDLRTPLTAISGYMDLLEQEKHSETVSNYLEIIKESIGFLRKLTEELFGYSVATSTLNSMTFETVSLNNILEESIVGYYGALKQAKITPNISIPEKEVLRKLDPNALARVFANIISNAIKYSDGDLNISLCEDGKIVFSNKASQLNELQVGRLFDRFYTVQSMEKSVGLGLSISKVLIEQMNGTILAQYNDGKLSIQIFFHN